MKIIAIGDVVSKPGLDTLSRLLRQVKNEYKADFVIVNGENTAGTGTTKKHCEDIFDFGADVITLGNHVFKKQQIADYLDSTTYVLRPANLAPQSPGVGYGIYDVGQKRVLLMNLLGRCDMQFGPDNPFLMADKILKDNEGEFDFAICEIHGNATSEKIAMGFYLDGRASAVYGTHTHVQTADERINPKGTGFITDIGMTGPIWSVLGVRPEQSIAMFRGDLTSYFEPAEGECAISGVCFEIDDNDGKCINVERIYRKIGI